MFICKTCGNIFKDNEESIDEHICQDCYDDEENTLLLALEII